jgi:hypothetical protein
MSDMGHDQSGVTVRERTAVAVAVAVAAAGVKPLRLLYHVSRDVER